MRSTSPAQSELGRLMSEAERKAYATELERRVATFFLFSSRRRHTRFDCDWSSDVCSSDLTRPRPPRQGGPAVRDRCYPCCQSGDRKSVEGKSVDLGGRRIIKKKKKKKR